MKRFSGQYMGMNTYVSEYMFGPTLSGNAAACKYFSDAVEFSVKSIAAFAAGDTDNAKALQAQAKSIESYAAGLLGI